MISSLHRQKCHSIILALVSIFIGSSCKHEKCSAGNSLNSSVGIYQYFEPQRLRNPIPKQTPKYLPVDTAWSVGTYYFMVTGNHTGSRMRFVGENAWFYGDTVKRIFDIGNAPGGTNNGRKYGNVSVNVETWRGPDACYPKSDTIRFTQTFYFDEGPYYCDTNAANKAYGWGTYTGVDNNGNKQTLKLHMQDFVKNAQAEPCNPVTLLEGLLPGYPNILHGFWNRPIASDALNRLYGDFNRNRGYITCAYFERDGREITFFGWYERRTSNQLFIDYTVYNQKFSGSIEHKTFRGNLIARP